MKHSSRSLSQERGRVVLALCGVASALGLAACAPFTQRESRPTTPLRAAHADATAELVWFAVHGDAIIARVRVEASAKATVERAALVQPLAAHDHCPATENGCDPLDPRFTTGTTATVVKRATDYVLLFPRYGGLRELAGNPRVLLDVKTGEQHHLLEVELDKNVSFRSGNWGLGGAIRYRPPAAIHRRVGNALSAELGGERWLGRTRLYLGYEIGLAGCRAQNASETASCKAEHALWLFGGVFEAAYDLRLNRAFTLGLGLGYVGLGVAAKDRSLVEPAFRHGPRLTLQLLQTPLQIRRFADEPPKLAAGPELALELLFHDRFADPRVAPSIAWAYGGVF